MMHSLKISLQASAVLLAATLATGCNQANDPGLEYAPEMYSSIPYEPLSQVGANHINPMGINERTPAVGTIPRGKLAYYTHIAKDDVATAEATLKNPYAYTKAHLEEGKVLYSRNCQHCHGEQGDGQGPVGIKFKGVPNYSAGAYKNQNDGHIVHVIQWGRNRMMPHGSQVNPEERWKIAMYVRALQLGKGPDGLADMVQVGSANANVPTADSTMTSGQMKTNPTKAGSNEMSKNPGAGDPARNGEAI
ncbi:quinol:cytochrome c oxidoreductase monoheme cytochrome subunit [Hymenobacter actinosclerus]|uniref:Quinol:cytochrome c oxidoreductase monoheme cytochrome subunit n=2 Tax=Hymenobacter actinosclerus TaxID=82805 RepID=A0A1I0AUN1_9BACT|nr:quinol:cytochrome c oxidoreductase monoheme cytochrome subunit [Hymenobacter actinosclerus]